MDLKKCNVPTSIRNWFSSHFPVRLKKTRVSVRNKSLRLLLGPHNLTKISVVQMTFQLGKINKLKNIVSLKVKLVGIDNQMTVTLEHCDSLLVSKSQAYCSV